MEGYYKVIIYDSIINVWLINHRSAIFTKKNNNNKNDKNNDNQ